ncbi:MAG: cytochrome c3 family protein [Verrucomicrobia subdivision 3 bacterium]|nr:cytochrome c3 family protein [Limisphaerales bacterium]
MKRVALILCQAVCALQIGVAAAEKPAIPAKLAALLAATGEDRKPVITPEQRTYFEGLNDHITALLSNATETEIITRADHLGSILALGLRPQKMEVLLQDNCILCHTDPEVQKPETLFSLSPPAGARPHLNLRHVVDDVHFARGLSCSGCHGGDPANDKLEHTHVKEWPGTDRDKNRAWILAFCARCHSDPALMNRFNPGLPTDQLAKYKESPHGKLLIEAKDPRAPDCLSCHGVHGIRNAKNPLSTVNAKRVHETCGACHANPVTMAGFKLPDGSPLPTNQVAEYRASVHGRALLERGDLGAPTCNKCHGNHAAMPVGLASVSQSCGLCHAGNASLFDGSKHKKAFEEHKWAQCAKCHGNHGIVKTHDGMLGTGADSMCVDCHQQYAKNNPECNATAEYFHATIARMDEAWSQFGVVAEQLAMRGLDVDPIHDKLNELADTIKQARAHIHSFSRNNFDQVVAPGNKAVESISALTDGAKTEYRSRQLGLGASIVLIGVMMMAVYLKLRRLERQEEGSLR